MANNVDERQLVLSMDESDLERGAKSAIKSLNKLDEAMKLNGAYDGIDNLQKSINNVDFSKLHSAIDSISEKLSFKNIIKASVIQNLTNDITNHVKKTVHSINELINPLSYLSKGVNQALTGGKKRADKIDQAKFKIEGLGQEWDKVSQRIDYGVTDTAYGFDQAANAASQLVAAGVEMSEVWDPNNVDLLGRSLRAISGAAAMTGANYDLVSDIFIDSAAAGKVTTDALNRLAWQGLNAKKTLSDVLHVSQEEVAKMATKGQISFEMFANAMNDAYGEQATKSNKTLEGSLDNMKAALNRIGAEFFFPIRKAGVQVFNATRLQLKAFKNLLGSTTDDVKDDFVDKFANIIEKGSEIITRFINSIPVDSLKGIIDYGGQVLDVIGDVLDGLLGWMDSIPWLAKKEEDTAATTAETVENVANAEEHLNEIAQRVMRGDFGNGEERRTALEALGESYEMVQNKVNELMDCDFRYKVSAEDMAKYTNQATEANENLAESQESQVTAMEKLTKAREDFNNSLKENLEKGSKPEERAKQLDTTIRGLKDSFEIVGKTLGAIGSGAAGPLTEFFVMVKDGFSKGASSIGSYISKFKNFLDESGAYAKIQGATNTVLNVMLTGFKGLGRIGGTTFKALRVFGSKALNIFGQFGDRVSSVWDAFKQTSAYSTLTSGLATVKEQFGNLWDYIFQKADEFLDWFDALEIKLPEIKPEDIANGLNDAINWVTTHVTELKDNMLGVFDGTTIDIEGFKTNIQNGFKDLLDDPVEWAKQRLEDLKGIFKEIIALFTGQTVSAATDDDVVLASTAATFDSTEQKINNILESAETLSGENGIGGILCGVKEKFDIIKEHLSSDVEIIAGWGSTIADTLNTILEGIKAFFGALSSGGTGTGGVGTGTDTYDGFDNIIDPMYEMNYDAENGLQTLNDTATTVGGMSEALNSMLDSLKSVFEKAKETVGPIFDAILNFLAPLKDEIPTNITEVQDAVGTIATNFLAFSAVKGAGGAMSSLWNLGGLLKQVKKGSKHVNKILKSFKDIRKKVDEILDKVKTIPEEIAKIPKKVSEILDEAKKSIKKVTDNFVKIEKSFAKAIKAEARLRNAKALLLVVAAIAILAFVLAELTKLDFESKKVRYALYALLAIIAAVAILMLAMGVAFGGRESKAATKGGEKVSEVLQQYKGIVKDFLKSIGRAATIAAIGAAVAMIGAVAIGLGLIPFRKALQGVFFAGLLLGGLVLALKALDASEGNGIKFRTGLLAIMLAVTLGLLAGVVKELGRIRFGNALQGTAFLVVLMIALTEALKEVGKMELQGSTFKKIVLLFAICLAMKSLVKTLLTLGKADLGTVAKGVIGLAAIMFGLRSVLKTVGNMQNAKFGAILAITLAVVALSGAMLMLGSMSGKRLAKAVAALVAIRFVLKGLLKAGGNMDMKSALPIVSMVAVIAAIVVALKVLGSMPADSLKNATLALDSVMAIMALLMKAVGSMTKGPSDKWKSILASVLPMLAGVGAAVGGILLLDKFGSDSKRIKSIADSLSEVMISLAAIIGAVSLLPDTGGSGGFVNSQMNTFTHMLETVEWMAFGTALVTALGALKSAYDEFVPAEVKEAIEYWIGEGKTLLLDIVEFIGEIGGSLLKGLLAPILGLVIGDGGMTGFITELKGFVEEIVPFVTKSNEVPEDGPHMVQKLVDVLLAMGAAGLAGIAAKIIGNFLDGGDEENGGLMGLMDTLEQFMTRYNTFDNVLIDFNPKASGREFDRVEEVFRNLDHLGIEAILSSLIGKVVKWVDGDGENSSISALTDKLTVFIQSYQIFSRKLSHVSTDSKAVDKIKGIGDVIRELNGAAVPATLSGLFNFILNAVSGGDNSIGAAGIMTKMAEFLRAYTEFENAYKDVGGDPDVTKVNKMTELIDAFSDSAWSGAGADTANQNFTYITDDGETGLTQIVGKLQAFLAAYIVFYPWLEAAVARDGQVEKIGTMGTIIGAFAGAAESAAKVSEYNSLIGVGESGKSELVEVLEKLGGFVDAYIEFYDKLGGLQFSIIGVTKVNNMRKVFEAFADSAWEGARGKVATLFTGEDGIKNLATKIGEAYDELYTTTTKHEKDINAMATVANGIKETFSIMQQIYWMAQGVDSNTTAGELGNLVGAIEKFYRDMSIALTDSKYTKPLTDAGKGMFEALMGGMVGANDEDGASGGVARRIVNTLFGTESFSREVNKSGEETAKSFLATMAATIQENKEGDNSIITKMTNLFSVDIVPACVETLTKSAPSFTAAMGTIVEGMRRTAQGLGWRLKSALQTALSSAVSTVRNYYSNFKSAGAYLMEGLAKGVTDNTSQATTAMRAAAKEGYRQAKDEMAVRSPSRVMMQFGKYIMEGWAIGIRDNTVLTNKAASNSAISLIQTMSSSVNSEAETRSQELYNSLLGMYQYVNYAINEALDTQPTITPVMDLSMIQNGANSINGMFGGTYGFGMNGIGYARSMYPSSALSASIQAKTQPVTASAIQGIREDIRFLGDSISKMQMVMDSGVLVGTIGGGMDRELGSIQKMRERWA